MTPFPANSVSRQSSSGQGGNPGRLFFLLLKIPTFGVSVWLLFTCSAVVVGLLLGEMREKEGRRGEAKKKKFISTVATAFPCEINMDSQARANFRYGSNFFTFLLSGLTDQLI